MPRPRQSKNTLPISIDPADYGPAMQALTPQQQAFVVAKVLHGLSDAAATRAAGYSASSPSTVAKQGWRLSHHPSVVEATLELTKLIFRSEGPRNLAVLMEIRDDKNAAARDRIRAVEMIMNRGGLNIVAESHLTVAHEHRTDEQKDREILRLARELGLGETEAKKLLISPDAFAKNSKGIYEVQPRELSTDPRQVGQRAAHARRKNMTPEQIAEDKARVRKALSERNREKLVANWREHGNADVIRDVEFVEVPQDDNSAVEPTTPENVDINLSDLEEFL